jgi:hypothetical protein
MEYHPHSGTVYWPVQHPGESEWVSKAWKYLKKITKFLSTLQVGFHWVHVVPKGRI